VAGQIAVSHHHWVAEDELRAMSSPHWLPGHPSWPSRRAGLTRRERWSDWVRQPFHGESGSHVSVWERSTARPAAHERSTPSILLDDFS
jgi:hypothetical protein